MTELKNLTPQLQAARNDTNTDPCPGRPVLAMRWTTNATSGRPVCHWVIARPHAVNGSDQGETIDAALKKARELSGTKVDPVAFKYICLDYLAGQRTPSVRN